MARVGSENAYCPDVPRYLPSYHIMLLFKLVFPKMVKSTTIENYKKRLVNPLIQVCDVVYVYSLIVAIHNKRVTNNESAHYESTVFSKFEKNPRIYYC